MDCNVLSEAYIKTCSLFLLQRCATVRPLKLMMLCRYPRKLSQRTKTKRTIFNPQVKCGFWDYWKFVKTMVASTEFRRKKKSVAAMVTHFHSQSCSNFWALDSVDSDTRLLSIYVISLAQSNYHHCLLKAHLYLCILCAIETKAQDVCVCVCVFPNKTLYLVWLLYLSNKLLNWKQKRKILQQTHKYKFSINLRWYHWWTN